MAPVTSQSQTVQQAQSSYAIHGLCLRASMEFPELRRCGPSGMDDSATILVQHGSVNPVPGQRTTDGFLFSPQQITVTVPGIAQYAVKGGRAIIVEEAPGANIDAVRAHLLGEVLPCLLHQRGLFPLHASAVATDRGAVAFSGNSGSGKSTLAAAFAEGGMGQLADDELVVTTGGTAPPLAWPSFPAANFTAESASLLGVMSHHQLSAYEKYGKTSYQRHEMFLSTPAPFRRLYCLEWSNATESATVIERLEGFEALLALRSSVLYRDLPTLLGHEAVFAAWAQVILRHAEIYRFRRPRNLAAIRDVLPMLLPSAP